VLLCGLQCSLLPLVWPQAVTGVSEESGTGAHTDGVEFPVTQHLPNSRGQALSVALEFSSSPPPTPPHTPAVLQHLQPFGLLGPSPATNTLHCFTCDLHRQAWPRPHPTDGPGRPQ
jgi:hypothetical protein